ncbi:CRISPR system Cascade subunit CasC [Bowdeniella nasicola]|uniref:CRISPR system Cascade subunit CasC n=1 Tax=Bowdeniella nasicola TaxID=208480 RepID=A0A1H4CLC2_9ACTO|nr:type I-E CRISPR-associated protein Cas7/Cse4/CasC [Bowdeniella nasicola]SEA61241.1 CRISPR system Cascade subunit CasC [Bowdeniella nasicola]
MSTFIDFHIVQDAPPSCINRDDNGSPKSAFYGGVARLRVSSQAWKRATREKFEAVIDRRERGTRTAQAVELVEKSINEQADDLTDRAEELAEEVVKATGIKIELPRGRKEGEAKKVTGYLLFLSNAQIDLLAKEAIDSVREEREIDKKTAKAVLRADNSIDLALFGRMVADWPDGNVDAACQVAHAISTHPAETEFDFFTAVDDVKAQAEDADAGAGMMGTVEFASATLYRYATINMDQLVENLGTTDSAIAAVKAFAEAFITSMPTGKVNTFANFTLPAAVIVTVRSSQPISYVGAFETPVRATTQSGYTEKSVSAIANFAKEIESTYRMTPEASFVVTLDTHAEALAELGERVSFPELAEKLTTTLGSSDIAS